MNMVQCCPPGHGCNAPGGGEPCALALCQAAAKREEDAAIALSRWGDFEAASEQGERRFRRRAIGEGSRWTGRSWLAAPHAVRPAVAPAARRTAIRRRMRQIPRLASTPADILRDSGASSPGTK